MELLLDAKDYELFTIAFWPGKKFARQYGTKNCYFGNLQFLNNFRIDMLYIYRVINKSCSRSKSLPATQFVSEK